MADVLCPKCHARNTLQRQDLKDRAKIPFTCAKCGYQRDIILATNSSANSLRKLLD